MTKNNSIIDNFFENLDLLNSQDLINLRICFGKDLKNVSNRYLISFYKVLPEYVSKNNEEIYFFIATLYAKQKEMRSDIISKSFYNIIKHCINNNDDILMNTIELKFKNLIMRYDVISNYSIYLRDLYFIIRIMNNLDFKVDEKSLLFDIIYWNNGEVSKKWMRNIYN